MKITKRKDGRYQANVYLGTDPSTGRRIQKTVSAKTKSECRAKANQILKDQDSLIRTAGAPKGLTLASMCDIYLSGYTGHLRANTIRKAEAHARLHIKPFFGQMPLTKITPVQVQSFVNALSLTLAPSTVSIVYGTLHRVLACAVDIGYLPEIPCRGVRLPKAEKPKIHPLSEDELKALLAACPADVYGDAIRLDALTGLRISELVALTWDRVDLDGRTMTVDRQLDGSGNFRPTKNGRARVVPLPDQAVRVLREARARQNEERMENRPYWTESGFVFTTPIGGWIRREAVRYHFHAICEGLGFKGVRFHDLRHTYAVLSLRSGVDYKSLSDALGHASVAFTMDVYAFTSPQMRRDHADRLSGFLADF